MSNRIFPILVSTFTTLSFLVLAFIFKLNEQPLWVEEGGIVETVTVWSYFVCLLLVVFGGNWEHIKKYHYFLLLILFFGLRELDFDKPFTTMGIFKSRFFFSSDVLIVEKLVGLFVIAVLLYVLISIIKNHFKDFLYKAIQGSTLHLGALIIIFFLVISKSMDGIGRKMSDFGYTLNDATISYFVITEEILELGIPLLFISLYYIHFRINNEKAS